MCCMKGSLREGAPDGVGWRSTRNNGLRTYNEIKIHYVRYSFRQPHRSPLVRSGCHLPPQGGLE